MQNKILMITVGIIFGLSGAVIADDDLSQLELENLSADSVAEYDVSGSVFEQITTLEQEKVLMQLEKERAQLDLELDKLAAEKIKLSMEIDTLSGRAEQQQQELEAAKAQLEIQTEKLPINSTSYTLYTSDGKNISLQQGCPESGFVTSQSITTAELSLGDQIHFEWSPDRKCTVQYLGDNRFKVISVENAKLQLGDSFSVMAFALGQPLYVSKLQRANKEGILQIYVAGYKTGLTKIYLNQKEKTSD